MQPGLATIPVIQVTAHARRVVGNAVRAAIRPTDQNADGLGESLVQ